MKMQRWTRCTMQCGKQKMMEAEKKIMAEQMCMDLKSEMMGEMMGGSGMGMDDMKPEEMNMEMEEDKEMSGSGDSNDMMTLPQVFMSMGMEQQAMKKCSMCAMECMEMDKDSDKNMMKKKMCLSKCVQKEKIQML